jgi:hypothetical protein
VSELQDESVFPELYSLDCPHVEHGLEITLIVVFASEGRLVYAQDLGVLETYIENVVDVAEGEWGFEF